MLERNYLLIFLFISLFNNIYNQECEQITAEIRYDCFKYSTSEEYCCFNNLDKKCLLVNKNEIKNNPSLDCGIIDNNYGFYEFEEYHPRNNMNLPFQTCGEKNPKRKQDCLEYSEISNSCCFFERANEKGCFYIGRRYSGDLKKKSFKFNNETIDYDCKSFSINFKNYFIFSLIVLLF